MSRDWTQEYFGITENTPVSNTESDLIRKLEIAVKALEEYANEDNWFECIAGFNPKPVDYGCYGYYGFQEAQEALAKIKEIK